MDFPINSFPSNTITDGNFLYRSLGTFWTKIFQEKGTLKGYTLGQAEEIIQRYYDLVETINSYSVYDVPIFHREKWYPLIIYKSKFNREPFVFEQDNAVFGIQPDTSDYYQGVTFQFGVDKTPIADVFVYFVGDTLSQFSLIADKVLVPSVILTYGTDVKLLNKSLYFNKNIFDNPNIPRSEVIGENGVPVTYKDAMGNEFNEEFIVLWVYNAHINNDNLFNNFGYIFNLKLNNTEGFKEILKSLVAIFVNGPTVNDIKSCCAAFMGVPITLNTQETVESIFADSINSYVVTDKECYTISNKFTLDPNIVVGTQLFAGDVLTTNIQYFDNMLAAPRVYYAGENSSTGWWNIPNLIDGKLAFSKYLFYGDYLHQLLFSTDLDVISLDSNGDIVFPVEGDPVDVATFHAYINTSSRKSIIKSTLGLTNPGDSYPTVPLNFVMENFLKSNTAMLKFDFYNEDNRSSFLSLLPIIRKHLPPYIYLILKITMTQPADIYDNLNDAITISFTSGDQLLNADGSNDSAMLEKLTPYNYNDVKHRLFELSLAVKLDPDTDLPYDYVATDSDLVPDGDAVSEGRFMRVKDGSPLHMIPEGVGTSRYANLLLIDFSS